MLAKVLGVLVITCSQNPSKNRHHKAFSPVTTTRLSYTFVLISRHAPRSLFRTQKSIAAEAEKGAAPLRKIKQSKKHRISKMNEHQIRQLMQRHFAEGIRNLAESNRFEQNYTIVQNELLVVQRQVFISGMRQLI